MKIQITLTQEQYDKLISELHEFATLRWNDDRYHAEECRSEVLCAIETQHEEVAD